MNTETGNQPLLLTPEQAAQRLGCSRSYLYGLLRSGELSSIQLGRLRRISTQDLADFVMRRTEEVRQARARAFSLLDVYRDRRGFAS